MPDITMCVGTNCPVKQKCHRFTAKPSHYQMYFIDPPLKSGRCDYYWGDDTPSIWEQLLDITKNSDESA